MMLVTGLIIIILLCIIWLFMLSPSCADGANDSADSMSEGYRSCNNCDGNLMAAGGTVVLNPYVWPYSGTQCVDDLYIANEDKGLNVGIDSTSLYSLTTPDHAVVTN